MEHSVNGNLTFSNLRLNLRMGNTKLNFHFKVMHIWLTYLTLQFFVSFLRRHCSLTATYKNNWWLNDATMMPKCEKREKIMYSEYKTNTLFVLTSEFEHLRSNLLLLR